MRNFLLSKEDIVLFVYNQLNGCCSDKEALDQVRKWQIQKLHSDARARKRALGVATAGGRPSHAAPTGTAGAKTTTEAAGPSRRACSFSAFVVPANWDRMEGAVGDDSRFWLAEDRGLECGSKEDLRIKWLAASASDPALYIFEAEDTEDVSKRFAVNVHLEKDGTGFRLPVEKRARLARGLEAFHVRESEGRRGGQAVQGVREECSLCGKYKYEDDEQVLCDTCNQGFHLECFVVEKVYFPDDVFKDGVEWDCEVCASNKEEVAMRLYDSERLVAKNAAVRTSRKGRETRLPARLDS